jgi:ferredoxin
MTFVVTESCIRCKYTDCVDVCPINAIFAEEGVPADQQDFIALNAEYVSL